MLLPVIRRSLLRAPAYRMAAMPRPFSSTRMALGEGTANALSRQQIEERIVNVLKQFDAVPKEKISDKAHFVSDFGLDSLDVVEVGMAIEEEFSIVIPDEEADNLLSVAAAIDYIAKSEAAT